MDRTKAQYLIQDMVDNSPAAERYFTDGYYGYMEIIFPGYHVRNERDKSDTHLVESVNADLRHYIPGLRRRSRIFYRTIETFTAVISLFVDAYNKFGERKMHYRQKYPNFKGDLPFSFFDYI
jgi:IS1 family transposase